MCNFSYQIQLTFINNVVDLFIDTFKLPDSENKNH